MDNAKAPVPPMSITVKVDGAPREIFASFALVNKLTEHVGRIENLGFIHVNPQLRELILEELLQERDSKGKVLVAKKLEDFDIAIPDTYDLLDFASEHILDFTLGLLERAAALQEKHQARASALKSLQTGQGS